MTLSRESRVRDVELLGHVQLFALVVFGLEWELSRPRAPGGATATAMRRFALQFVSIFRGVTAAIAIQVESRPWSGPLLSARGWTGAWRNYTATPDEESEGRASACAARTEHQACRRAAARQLRFRRARAATGVVDADSFRLPRLFPAHPSSSLFFTLFSRSLPSLPILFSLHACLPGSSLPCPS